MAAQSPIVSLGLLAYNQEHTISKTLVSLLTQDVFAGFETELIVVANGCTDRTATVARQCLADHRAVWSARGSARVEELSIAGKANAWNEFVHRLSSSQATFLVVMDADICLFEPDTVSNLVRTLETTPRAVVSVDQPIKDIALQETRTLFQRILLSATSSIDPTNVMLCGQLYCAWSRELRRFRLPQEIQMEDGFIRALLLTQDFLAPEDRGRIVLASGARHGYSALSTLRELFHHERWVVSGSIVNMLLFADFGSEARAGHGASDLMRDWSARDPQWLPHHITAAVRAMGWRLLPGFWWTRRWARLRGLPVTRKIARFPVAMAASAFDAVVFVAAINDVRRGRGYGYWGGASGLRAKASSSPGVASS